jgi:hypothetical protein
MTTVQLSLPDEVVRELSLPYEGVRGPYDLAIAIEGIDVVASIVTLAQLRPQLATLANALRRWRRADGQRPAVLTVDGPDIKLRLELPPNVQTTDVLAALQSLMEDRSA